VDSDAPAGGPWLPGYAHRKRITISGPIAAALADFPVSIAFAGDPDLAAGALADGSDIVFTAGDATTRLDAEHVAYAAATGALEAWVRTSIDPGSATTLFMYYGGMPEASAQTTWLQFAGV